jgi:CheY-like chemotaxis protein
MSTRPARILLVEDEDADIVHFQRLCSKHGVEADIIVARDADQALEKLHATPAEQKRRVIVVTDLNMPGFTGHELIDQIRSHKDTRSTVVFVLSTSDLPEDIKLAYKRHVAGYIVKDTRGERMEAGVMMLRHYLQAVMLP